MPHTGRRTGSEAAYDMKMNVLKVRDAQRVTSHALTASRTRGR
jgi:hypothetical protein